MLLPPVIKEHTPACSKHSASLALTFCRMADQSGSGTFVESVPSFDGIGRSYTVVAKRPGLTASASGGGRRGIKAASQDSVGGETMVPVPVALIMQLSPEVSAEVTSAVSSGCRRVSLSSSAAAPLHLPLRPLDAPPPVPLPSHQELAQVASRITELRLAESKAAAAAAAAAAEESAKATAAVAAPKIDLFSGRQSNSAPIDAGRAKTSISGKRRAAHGMQRIFGQESDQKHEHQKPVVFGGARRSQSEVDGGGIGGHCAVFLGPDDSEHGVRKDRERALGLSTTQNDIRLVRGSGGCERGVVLSDDSILHT